MSLNRGNSTSPFDEEQDNNNEQQQQQSASSRSNAGMMNNTTTTRNTRQQQQQQQQRSTNTRRTTTTSTASSTASGSVQHTHTNTSSVDGGSHSSTAVGSSRGGGEQPQHQRGNSGNNRPYSNNPLAATTNTAPQQQLPTQQPQQQQQYPHHRTSSASMPHGVPVLGPTPASNLNQQRNYPPPNSNYTQISSQSQISSSSHSQHQTTSSMPQLSIQQQAYYNAMQQQLSGGGASGGSGGIYHNPGNNTGTPPPHLLAEATSSATSPLPPMVQRNLGDRSNEKRKNAALEVEALIKSLTESQNFSTIQNVVTVLSKEFCTSMNSNYRKGGLVGLAATAIGLQISTSNFLHVLLPPVLHCFVDPESRVRYYACESLYNIAKVSRFHILNYFNPIFEGLTKLFADVDIDVKNGANLLNRLIQDVVTEADSDTFNVQIFLPILQNYIRRTNPYIRQLIVGWITLLDSLPDISMLDYLPDFLDGLFNMLSDSNREIRQAADSALSDFLRELSVSQVLEFGPIIRILVSQCQSKERLNRLTAITWLAELTHHPLSGGDALLPFSPDILSAILFCISDREKEIRLVAERTNDDLLEFVRDTDGAFELRPLLETLTNELLEKEDVPTKMAALRWINMLMEKRVHDMQAFTVNLLPVLLRTLSDPSDTVVLLDLQVLSRISLANAVPSNESNNDDEGRIVSSRDKKVGLSSTTSLGLKRSQPGKGGAEGKDEEHKEEPEEAQFQLVLNAILNLFAQDRQLLETRGSLIIRKLCVLLNAKAVYIRMAETLSTYENSSGDKQDKASTLQFISTMVQTLNLILLTASELHDLRSSLANSFVPGQPTKTTTTDAASTRNGNQKTSLLSSKHQEKGDPGVFAALFHCWCHNPVATFSLCLLAKAYDLSFALVQRFSEMQDVSVGFLMQIDKLVYLLESPIFVHLRLSLLNIEAPHHAQLLKSIYGILMCLPQGDAFRLLNDRLTTVCNLRDNLGVAAVVEAKSSSSNAAIMARDGNQEPIVSQRGLDMRKLLERFDAVMDRHREAAVASQTTTSSTTTGAPDPSANSFNNNNHGMVFQPPQQHQQQQQPHSMSAGSNRSNNMEQAYHDRATPVATNLNPKDANPYVHSQNKKPNILTSTRLMPLKHQQQQRQQQLNSTSGHPHFD